MEGSRVRDIEGDVTMEAESEKRDLKTLYCWP